MSTQNILSPVDKVLLSMNGITPQMVGKIIEKEVGDKKILCCYIKEPTFCMDGNTKLTREKSKRKIRIMGLGINGVPFHIIFWVKYFKREKPLAGESKNKRIDYDFLYRNKQLSHYSKQVHEKVIGFHLKNYDNADIVELLKECYGVEMSKIDVRRAIKYKHNNINIPKIEVKTLGVDETKVKGVNRICTVLLDLDRGIPLGIVKRKTADRLRTLITRVRGKGINLDPNLIVRDLYNKWDTVLKEEFGDAITIAADRFHAVGRIQKRLYYNVYTPLRNEYRAKTADMENTVLKKKMS